MSSEVPAYPLAWPPGWRRAKSRTGAAFNVGGSGKGRRLEVGACRGAVKLLLNALREMHVRDKERINRELARISSEQRALVPNE